MHPTFKFFGVDAVALNADQYSNEPMGNIKPFGTGSPTGVPPATIRQAYGVTQALFGSIVGDGTGQTIAIVDAFDLPTIASDLASFDAFYGLSAPPSFTKVNQTGSTTPLPSADAKGGWGVEIALDVQWAHVIAPKASILLVEANSASDADLYTAVDTARNWPGVSVVSMSWGGDEVSADSANDGHFTTPSGHNGVSFVASSGDNGAYSGSGSTTRIVSYPAVSKNVAAIGGTFLTANGTGAYVSESGWGNGTSSNVNGGSGGGISQFVAQPSYQTGVVTQSTTRRTIPDVSMNADPNSGVPVFDVYDNGATTPWIQVGGTSLSAPMWAGVLAIANQGRVLNSQTTLDGPTQTLPKLYSLPSSSLHDITTGNNFYAAGTGYDLVTGRGSPIVNLVVNNLIDSSVAIGTFTSSASSVGSGGYTTLKASNVTSNATVNSVKFYRETNSTTGWQASDTLIGTGFSSGSDWTMLASTAGFTSGTYTYYAIASDSNGTTSVAKSVTLTVSGSSFSNWSGIEPALSRVSSAAGALTNVSVVDFGSTVYTGALNVSNTVNRIRMNNGSSLDPNDGGVYNNSNGALPSASTWYEFVVAPSNGANINFSGSPYNVSSPGPMRLVVNNVGDVYYTGDHYSTFNPLYLQTQSPAIASFSVSPSTVAVGSTIGLTASGVTQTGATISNVSFYRESNGVSGLQPGSDIFVGLGVQNGTTWALPNQATTGLVAGSYTYYAQAMDSSSAVKTSTSTLTVSSGTNGGSNGVLLAWNMTGQTAFGTQGLVASTIGSGLTNTLGLTRGSGVTTTNTAASNAWGGNGWASTSTAGVSGNQFVSFGFTVSAGQIASLSSVDLNYRRSASGSANGLWQYQINAGSWTDAADVTNEFSSTSTSGAAMTELSLSGISGLQSLAAGTAVNFRLVPYGATTAGGTWYVYDLTGDDLVVLGSVQAANSAPTNVTLSATSIAENQPANSAIGTFSSNDPDTGNTFTYSLVTGTGSTDNASFSITGNTLNATASFDYETKNSYSIRVRTTDQGGLFFEKVFTITVINVNEAVVLTRANSTVSGNVLTQLSNSGTWADPESGAVTLTASLGTVTKNADGTWGWSYQATDFVSGQVATIFANDGTNVSSVTFTITAFSTIATRGLVYAGATGASASTSLSDKVPLLPGQSSTFDNYTSYSRGLNGLVIDVPGLPASTTTSQLLSSLVFAQWDGIAAAGFVALPGTAVPTAVIASGVGSGGSVRATITFPDNTIQNTWLQVTILANATTGLAANDVFYFGNVIGDVNTGNTATRLRVNALDSSAVRNNQSPGANSVGVANIYDINRDGRVNALDTSIVRNNQQTAGIVAPITAPSARVANARGSSSSLGAIRGVNAAPIFGWAASGQSGGTDSKSEHDSFSDHKPLIDEQKQSVRSFEANSSANELSESRLNADTSREAPLELEAKKSASMIESIDGFFASLWSLS
jgi:ribonuclease/Cadherin domain/Dockerin type I domain